MTTCIKCRTTCEQCWRILGFQLQNLQIVINSAHGVFIWSKFGDILGDCDLAHVTTQEGLDTPEALKTRNSLGKFSLQVARHLRQFSAHSVI